ncbi:ribosomal protein L1 [Macrolepiota fuliginosa MF-IS2]|uniref:Ribosomal L1 domain-containing protein 1 n=1 Tax=Macrolepiota fuliginosa MF-IS2 TaxID=1400762 RepID=A0A9P6C8Q6_9AGAR|nr:ribosomal protein L1 [Macrolepiota fuliginosa MF-IS2]
MTKEDLIDDRVSPSQIQKAVDALHTYESKKQQEREETELLPGKEPNIWLNITVKQVAPKNKIKPVKIPIVHPIVDPRTTSICLITKDPQREYKELLETHNIKFISRVVGIEKLKGKFKAFEARRLLLKENGLFLADDRIIPLLPKLLGSKWFEAKKQPIPVCLTRKDLKGELERAISSTYMNQNNGTCTSIKIGTLTHKPTQVTANITKAIPAIVSHIPGGWDNIQTLFIKTNTSVSLPVWSCDLSERWSGLVSNGKGSGKEVEAGEKKTGKKKEQSGAAKSVGKKRPVEETNEESEESEGGEDEDEVEEQPRKKIKAGESTSARVTRAAAKSKKSASTPTDQKPKKSAKPTPTPPTDTPKSAAAGKKSAPAPTNAEKKSKAKAANGSAPSAAEGSGKKSDLTKAELKQKRTAAGTSDKKEKVLGAAKGSSNGKKLKAKLLGKKAMQA